MFDEEEGGGTAPPPITPEVRDMIDKQPQSKMVTLLGYEAVVELEIYGDDEGEGLRLDLLPDSAWFAGFGVLLPGETIVPAEEISGNLTVELGDNDRVMWFDGGRDLNEREFCQAVNSGLMCVLGNDALMDEWIERCNARALAKRNSVMRNIVELDLISAKKLDKKRKEFGGRTARELVNSTSIEDADLLGEWVVQELANQNARRRRGGGTL